MELQRKGGYFKNHFISLVAGYDKMHKIKPSQMMKMLSARRQ